MARLAALAGATVALLASVTPAQDVVQLLDGTRIEGRVVFESEDVLVVRKGSRDREVRRDKVRSVEAVARSLGEALRRWDALDARDAAAVLDLARYCKAHGLEGEASVLAHWVLAADPDDEAAHLVLEHEKRGEGWIVRDGNKRVPFSRLAELRQDWGDGWRLRTTHYELATNLDLRWACALALELELFYRAFYARFGAELELYEVVEPMVSHVHADKASFPEGSGRTAYFSPGSNVLVQLALDGLVLDVLAHEATHQILHNTALERRKGSDAIPPWLHEGLAEYLSSLRTGDPGRAKYDDGLVYAEHFARHASSKDPYDLGRILTFGAGDFSASSRSDLKYAQAYTLVRFCLHGDGGGHRDGFLEFLRGAYRGKGSSTDFKAALGIEERVLEKAWTRYAESGG